MKFPTVLLQEFRCIDDDTQCPQCLVPGYPGTLLLYAYHDQKHIPRVPGYRVPLGTRGFLLLLSSSPCWVPGNTCTRVPGYTCTRVRPYPGYQCSTKIPIRTPGKKNIFAPRTGTYAPRSTASTRSSTSCSAQATSTSTTGRNPSLDPEHRDSSTSTSSSGFRDFGAAATESCFPVPGYPGIADPGAPVYRDIP
eukprot:1157504-Rhodomonas_salina.1